MEAQHKAYRQLSSVFGIASVPNTDFGSSTPNKFKICSHWLESVWKSNLTAYRRIRSVFGIASVFGIEDQNEVGQYLESVGQYLGSKFSRSIFGISKLRSKLTGFEIEVGLAKIETKRLVFQLVIDQCSN